VTNAVSAGTVTFARINPAHNTLTVNILGGKVAIAPNASTASVINTLAITDPASSAASSISPTTSWSRRTLSAPWAPATPTAA